MKVKHLIRSCLRKIRNCIVKVFNLFPISDIILFESNPDFNDEGYWMCRKFLDEKMDQKYKIYWYIKSHDSKIPDGWNISCIYLKPRSLRQWIEKYYVLHTTRCILDSCLFVPKRRKEQFRLFLNHGMPVKMTDKYMKSIGDYDYVSIGSPYFLRYYSWLKIPIEKQVVMGMARNDQLERDNGYVDKLFPGNSGRQKIIWMPTYRQHVISADACNIPINENSETGLPIINTYEDLTTINQFLQENNQFLIIKPHQSQNLQYLRLEELNNIKFITAETLQNNEIQLYALLGEMDALITDYSSVYIDFLLTRRPIGLTIDDFDIYQKKVGFAVDDYMKDIQGFHIKDLKDFRMFLTNVSTMENFMSDQINEAFARFHSVTDYSSSERLYQFILKKAEL